MVPKQLWGSTGIRTYDLRDTGAMLYVYIHNIGTHR